jgi:ABC-2 type transport system ATP-binding protein
MVQAMTPVLSPPSPILSILQLTKRYPSGLVAVDNLDLSIAKGEIFALLGPNGAGKSTLINIVCGIVTPSGGKIEVDGLDIERDYRAARARIGLVPQELTTDAFETVWATVSFSRRLFGRGPDPAYLEQVLRDLSLWDKRKSRIMQLSGGMKRRVMIAKALAHEPDLLFLDEPTAGVDVELRRDMWALVRRLRAGGVTIVLTTHYIDEAEEMADRIGIINKGRLIVAEEKTKLMQKLGKRHLTLTLQAPMASIPEALGGWPLALGAGGTELEYTFDAQPEPRAADAQGRSPRPEDDPGGLRPPRHDIPTLLGQLAELGIGFKDLHTRQSSLEDIFVGLVSDRGGAAA